MEEAGNNEESVRGLKLLAWARAVRWIGWGFGESLIPVFLFMFVQSFAEAGLLRSAYEIVMLITLPIVGAWVDRKSAKYLVLFTLALYPLVGLSYFFAGVFGLTIFIVLARALNGFLWSTENVAVNTYYRRVSKREHIGISFGYIDTWSNFWWIIAALCGAVLASFVPIHYLLLLIFPAAIIAFFIVQKAPKDNPAIIVPDEERFSFVQSYKLTLIQWKSWDRHLWTLGCLVLFLGSIEALMWFFIPIDAYIKGANPTYVVLLTVVGAIPLLFSYMFGKIADKYNKYKIIILGLIGIALILSIMAIFPQYIVKLVASFFLSIILTMFTIVQKSLVTVMGPSNEYGKRGSAFDFITTIGDVSAPIILGLTMDLIGFNVIAYSVAIIACVFCVGYLRLKKTFPIYTENL